MIELKPMGNNKTLLIVNGMKVLFSYKTPVACEIGLQYYKTNKKFSKTTTKHINTWLDGVKAEEKNQEFFDGLVMRFNLGE
ncbi:MAG: Prochlorococcus phage [Pseudomonadota bacterium]|jgi:hypothetical protein